jgi:glutamate dehydrogenase
MEDIPVIAGHIMSLYASKIFAYLRNDNSLELHLEREGKDKAVYIHSSRPGVSQVNGPQYESR